MEPDVLAEHLARTRDELERFLRREASGLLRFEGADDLVQGVHARALAAAADFEYRDDPSLRAWLFTLARRHVADRHDHWSAMKRGASRVVRYTLGGGGTGTGAVPLPIASATGPATFAARRELLELAAKALAVLPERDQSLVRWMSEGVPLEEQAERLELSYAAVQRAGLRAIERYKKAFQVVGGAS